MKLRTLLLLPALVATSAYALTPTDGTDSEPQASSEVVSRMVGTRMNEEDRQKAENLGKLFATESLKAMQNNPQAASFQAQAASASRRADDIANASMAQERARVLKFLGINPDGDSSIYYFVSWSMPIELLRAYAMEAMWSGGTLIFRGIPADMDLKTYVTKQLSGLVYGKGASAALSIDPRMFDAYEIKTVPTIVYSEERKNFECFGQAPHTVTIDKQQLPLYTCPPVDPNKYWKISGAVTSDYALRQIIEAGAAGAKPYLAALAKGFATGEVAPKLQQGFTGEWKEALSPADLKAIQDATQATQQTGKGVASN